MSENRFAKAAQARKLEQEKIMKRLNADIEGGTKEERTVMTISLTVEDKKKLKMLALERETTVSRLIHEWINK